MSDSEKPDSDDKTHEPTHQRIQKSREDGDVPYSREATAAVTYAAFYVAIIALAGWVVIDIHSGLAPFLADPEAIARLFTASDAHDAAGKIVLRAFRATIFFLSLLGIAALLSVAAQQAFAFSPKKIQPKLSRLSIVDNAKQKYGTDGLVEFAKTFCKLSAVLGVVLFAMKDRFLAMPSLVGLPAQALPQHFMKETVFFIGLVTAAAVLIGGIDLPWRFFQHRKKLRMTHDEVKRESKENEGDPMLKSARRQRAQAIAMNQMMGDVPQADIVMVNPTHYAVALKWDRESGRAPICVAKGVDEIAARIREIAAENGVPIKRDPPTTRSIYAMVEIGEEIKREHFAAVAAAVHYADTIRKKMKSGKVL